MPALLEDPLSPLAYRMSGQQPFPTAENPQIPSSIFPRPVTLRDRVTIATLIPFFTPDDVPKRLLAYLSNNLNKEIEGGDTYPMIDTMPLDQFGKYWFGNFGAVMVLGDIGGIEAVNEMESNGTDWNKLCLGSFYVKPNYPGRSSHVCNGGFLVTPAARNKGVGKSMGQCYLDWAPQLGYTYSVFNLVYETNTASTKIWDSLGFKRIGRVPACGVLKSYSEPVDAIIYGRDLKAEGENIANEERFDKIRYYLRHSSYPQGADRSEKSRLRSAATHYKLIGGEDGVAERLMLKDKEVISDPQAQYDIAKQTHLVSHGGINKTTAMIATKYHWVRIKETVSHVIKNCAECKESSKTGTMRADSTRSNRNKGADDTPPAPAPAPPVPQNQPQQSETPPMPDMNAHHELQPNHITAHDFGAMDPHVALAGDPSMHDHDADLSAYDDMAIDPTILAQLQAQMASDGYQNHHHDFVPAGLADYVDASQLQQPQHDHHGFNGFNGQHPDQQFIHNPGQAMMTHDHVMDDGTDETGLNNMAPMQNVLHMDYINNDGNYKQ
ncbi:uncharacterized protein HMPREF1541_02249 [Cyphellophora europaea CBS 101466]|uniref:N-acetyltransferase domain-containing protein n=1 Tax=Cyphellophora europaea (strain CBS 101466) TaxID=1220924 RepID=W2S301_CYPE1|nr:uncharacterized protein HMPREF1541_02249 [Cyphellophora europaea CBS 101466]ETN43091.1 hypothetical protein HMPREF1541_02249 [Cyphellophora europaea CBS 101466]